MAAKVPHPWSKEALLAKSQRFFEEMLEHPRDDWQYGHWSTLALELLARAALSNVSPALLAEAKDWNNLYYALGHEPKAQRFVGHSVGVADVFKRLGDVVEGFTPNMVDFGILHMNRRNEELHSGKTPFDSLNSSKWLPEFFESCSILIQSMGKELDMLIGETEAEVATTMIEASRDKAAQAVNKAIAEHKKKWEELVKAEQDKLSTQAVVWANRRDGHRVVCPACKSQALVHGRPIAAAIRTLVDDDIVETQQYLPVRFECVACGLKISGFSQINAAGVGDTYKSTSTYSAAEYYDSGDRHEEYEEDNNER